MKTKNEKLDIINMIDDVFILEHDVLWSHTRTLRYINDKYSFFLVVLFLLSVVNSMLFATNNQLCKSFIAS